jgi:hypothetical protein
MFDLYFNFSRFVDSQWTRFTCGDMGEVLQCGGNLWTFFFSAAEHARLRLSRQCGGCVGTFRYRGNIGFL